MSLRAGQKLGPYELADAIGAGGMGEVYRARDTRLDRTVAIKVLPAHLSASAELQQRFEREARAISSLNHPHICSLFDVGQQDGISFLVMEHLEGGTLAQRLEKGPLPLGEVLKYAVQILDALGKAHRQGVVHRDLKPGNIMLTPQGAKLMDFGLAKMTMPTANVSSLTAPANATSPITTQGTIVGTFHYMSPEQVEGKEADARSDLFSFGAVLYEMVTGRRAFQGKSQLSVASAILEKEPEPVSALAPATPPALDHVIRKCLAKDTEDRWQTARDLQLELKWISDSGSQAGVAAPVVARQKWRERMWMTVAAALLVAALGLLAAAYSFRKAASDVRPLRAYILPPAGMAFGVGGGAGGPMVISPDGKHVAFVAHDGGKRTLWVRSLDSLTAQMLSGTDDASFPFWSPDSRSLGFFSTGKLKRIDVVGGPPLALCDLGGGGGGRGGSWNQDGVILFTPNTGSPIMRVSSTGGTPAPVTKVDASRKQGTHRWPYFLPDQNRFLYLARATGPGGGSLDSAEGIYLGSLDGKEDKLLVRAVSSAAYASGYLLFVREGILMAQAFDAQRNEVTADAFPLVEQVKFDVAFSLGAFSVSENGMLIYHAGGVVETNTKLQWFDRAGKEVGQLGDAAMHYDERLSWDGQRVAVSVFDPYARNIDIWIHDMSRGLRTRLTFDAAFDRFPVWSPDGSRIVFGSSRNGQYDLYVKRTSGAGNEELLLTTGLSMYPTDWSADGQFVLYYSPDPKSGNDLWVLPMTGERKPIPFLSSPFDAWDARFSPDGKWIAYVSNESGTDQVYVAPFPGPGGKWQISSAGGTRPSWRRDGKEIVYLAVDDKMMAAEVSAKGGNFEVGAVRQLFFAKPQRFVSFFPSLYSATPDTQRFLFSTARAQSDATPVVLVQQWNAGLKK